MKKILTITATAAVMAAGLISLALAGDGSAPEGSVQDLKPATYEATTNNTLANTTITWRKAEIARKAAEAEAARLAAEAEAARVAAEQAAQAVAEEAAQEQHEAEVIANEEADAWSILASYGLDGVSLSYGETYGYEAISYYKSGHIVINPNHTTSLSTLIAHEVEHIIAWRQSGKTTE